MSHRSEMHTTGRQLEIRSQSSRRSNYRRRQIRVLYHKCKVGSYYGRQATAVSNAQAKLRPDLEHTSVSYWVTTFKAISANSLCILESN